MKGRITKGVGGLYTLYADGEFFKCKARGILRKNGVSPLVGDFAEFESDGTGDYVITGITDRKNSLIRPAVANIDILFIVISSTDPMPNTFVIDKTIAVAEYKGIEPILIITKTDLAECDELAKIYRKAGIDVFVTNIKTHEGFSEIEKRINGKACTFTGNSGVGKSTLLNNLFPDLNLATSQTSAKLGRGRHTTRHVEMFLKAGGFIADTPGFSAVDIEQYDVILKDELQDCFREFREYIGNCKFTGCSHTSEKGCAVIEAVKLQKIAASRHENYVKLYNEVKNIKEWELSKYGRG